MQFMNNKQTVMCGSKFSTYNLNIFYTFNTTLISYNIILSYKTVINFIFYVRPNNYIVYSIYFPNSIIIISSRYFFGTF